MNNNNYDVSIKRRHRQGTFTIHLPEGKTMKEINNIALEQLPAFVGKMQDYDINVIGDCTIALAMLISYELSFACRSVRVFDPKENVFIKVFDIDDLKNSSETNVLLAIKKQKDASKLFDSHKNITLARALYRRNH